MIKKIPLFLLLVIFCFALCGCETLNVKNMDKTGQFQKEDDEARLWKRQDEFEEIINTSGFIYQDEQLNNYVEGVLCKLTGELEKCNNVNLRVYIIRDPELNAFCLSNGAIYIHTGLLANIDNEAQLATILGHESAHFFNRHELKAFRGIKNKTAFLSSLQITLAGGSAFAGSYGSAVDLVNRLAGYSVAASVYGYSREVEREADKVAFEFMIVSGYDPAEAKKFFDTLYELNKDEKENKAPYLYQTHPRIKERIDNFDGFIKKASEEKRMPVFTACNIKEHNRITRQLLLDNCELEIKANKPKHARRGIDKYVKLYPDDAEGYYLSGTLYLAEGKNDEAQKELKKSIEVNPRYPESHRALGMMYYKKGDKQLAEVEFRKYLELVPDAKDKDYIRRYIDEKKQ
ncbi:MAG: M48 family metalloprotease [Candidatus Omnitrophica bacterium]|nr:M48 family metalloprotease [Candidatus Omnitrophota bacterium]